LFWFGVLGGLFEVTNGLDLILSKNNLFLSPSIVEALVLWTMLKGCSLLVLDVGP
jgi:hypothetical protein